MEVRNVRNKKRYIRWGLIDGSKPDPSPAARVRGTSAIGYCPLSRQNFWMGSEVASSRSAPTEATFSSEILQIAGDPARPRAPMPPYRRLAHLPGDSSVLTGMRCVAGLMRD